MWIFVNSNAICEQKNLEIGEDEVLKFWIVKLLCFDDSRALIE
jgi:hypothetical protein